MNEKYLKFLRRLDEQKIPYMLRKNQEDAIGVLVIAPGEYWEVDFLADGEVYVERFKSDGRIHDEASFDELFALWSDQRTPAVTVANDDDDSARK